MSLLQAILMGIIQGLTEFLPVSSSGHLAIFKILFGVDTDTGLLFDVLLHIGTLAAICIVYYKDVLKMIVEANRNRSETVLLTLSGLSEIKPVRQTNLTSGS